MENVYYLYIKGLPGAHSFLILIQCRLKLFLLINTYYISIIIAIAILFYKL